MTAPSGPARAAESLAPSRHPRCPSSAPQGAAQQGASPRASPRPHIDLPRPAYEVRWEQRIHETTGTGSCAARPDARYAREASADGPHLSGARRPVSASSAASATPRRHPPSTARSTARQPLLPRIPRRGGGRWRRAQLAPDRIAPVRPRGPGLRSHGSAPPGAAGSALRHIEVRRHSRVTLAETHRRPGANSANPGRPGALSASPGALRRPSPVSRSRRAPAASESARCRLAARHRRGDRVAVTGGTGSPAPR